MPTIDVSMPLCSLLFLKMIEVEKWNHGTRVVFNLSIIGSTPKKTARLIKKSHRVREITAIGKMPAIRTFSEVFFLYFSMRFDRA